ncbi:MAG TPA: flagellar hook-length control protein FliK [Clostridia bacterium]|nr:flagellar hook-length control protein FliK [Clostridia bacterium]
MINSIELFAAFKAGKPNSSTGKADFPGCGTKRDYSFNDSLREAGRSISRENSGSIRKEMVSRSEAKLKKVDKKSFRADEKVEPQEETKEKQIEKVVEEIEKILAALQKLADLQQDGQQAQEDLEALQEGIKGAYQELSALQSKLEKLAGANSQVQTPLSELQEDISEFRTLLEGMLNELKADGTENTGSSGFLQKLEAAVKEALPKLEAITGSQAEGIRSQNEADKLEAPAGTAAQAEMDTAVNNSMVDKEQERTAEDSQTEVAAEYGNAGTKTDAAGSKTAKKGISAENTENEVTEEEKAALEEKTEKITVASREDGKQDNAAGREASKEIHTAAAAKQSKTDNEGMINILQEQEVPEEKAEAAANQTEAPRAQTAGRAEIINQIVKKAEIVLTDSQSEMRMQLEPENLGKLTLKLAVERGLITAKFTAESYEVKQVIESSFNELKDMLQEKGLEVQNFSVSVGQENKEYNNGNTFQQWKETVKLNGSRSKGGYEGYFGTEADTPRAVNPYSVHNGEFDHIA